VLGGTLARLDQPVVPAVPVAPTVAERVRTGTRDWPGSPILVTGTEEKYDAFAASAAAVTKSGTATLELAMAGVAMLVTYKVNPLSAALARRLVKVPYASLLNLLGEREIVPELIQEACAPDRLAAALQNLLAGPAATAQRAAFAGPLAALRPPAGSPSEAAADLVLDLLDEA
jgi:lipid-A-disaccharide synthase